MPDSGNDSTFKQPYRGRFAPSPTGPLHFGSLITAVASYLDARHANGEWLLRIEDVDTPRTNAGAVDSILTTLELYGFEWDGEVVYQSQRSALYEEYLAQLAQQSLVYGCECSRKSISEYKKSHHYPFDGYPAICRNKGLAHQGHTIRINTESSQPVGFKDEIQGELQQTIAKEVGDFVLKRHDGVYSYQLAVVVDDELQQINHIVRGFDLFDNTPRQLLLQHYLGFKTPNYCHIPIAVNEQHQKLSKQTHAAAIDGSNIQRDLMLSLRFLGQPFDENYLSLPVSELWNNAIKRWDRGLIPRKSSIEFISGC